MVGEELSGVWGVGLIKPHTSLDPLLGAPSCQRGRWRGGGSIMGVVMALQMEI